MKIPKKKRTDPKLETLKNYCRRTIRDTQAAVAGIRQMLDAETNIAWKMEYAHKIKVKNQIITDYTDILNKLERLG